MSLGRKPYMFQNLLICTDLHDGLHRLVRFVPSLAASGIRKLVFFHSVRLDDDRGVAKVDKPAMEAARQIPFYCPGERPRWRQGRGGG